MIEGMIKAHDWEGLRRLFLVRNASSRKKQGREKTNDSTALQLACIYYPDLAEELVEGGCPWDFHSACALGDTYEIRKFANKRSMSQQKEWMTPMGWAIFSGKAEAVETLLDCGDDPSRKLQAISFYEWEHEIFFRDKWFPIHAACAHGYHRYAHDIVQSLIEAGARVEEQSPLGHAPLAIASTYSWLPTIWTLLNLGADINARSIPESDRVWRVSAPEFAVRSFDLTPLMIATGEGQEEAVRMLIDRGADISLFDSRGWTALHYAAAPWWRESTEIVEMLLEANVDVSVENQEGQKPLDLALQRNLKKTAALLSS